MGHDPLGRVATHTHRDLNYKLITAHQAHTIARATIMRVRCESRGKKEKKSFTSRERDKCPDRVRMMGEPGTFDAFVREK